MFECLREAGETRVWAKAMVYMSPASVNAVTKIVCSYYDALLKVKPHFPPLLQRNDIKKSQVLVVRA